MIEERFARSAQFITLTYAPENVCASPVGRRLTLVKNHVQCFIKKLRRCNDGGSDIKYYAVGEYGTTFSRPHYHVLLFNADIESIQPCWQYGSVYYGTVNGASVGYCLKYMCKERIVPAYKADDRVPEFGLFSKGLGKSYLTPEMKAWHLDDLLGRMYIPLEGGKKIAMCRYFKELVYTPGQRRFFELNYKRMEFEENSRTFQSNSPTVRLKSFVELRGHYESFNSAVRKQRSDFFKSRSSIF